MKILLGILLGPVFTEDKSLSWGHSFGNPIGLYKF